MHKLHKGNTKFQQIQMLLIFYKNLTKTYVFGVKMQFFSLTLRDL